MLHDNYVVLSYYYKGSKIIALFIGIDNVIKVPYNL